MRHSPVLLTIVLTSTALRAQTHELDSLELRMLSLQVAAAAERVVATDLFHRLLPRLTLSVSFGTRNMVFTDPDVEVPGFIPADTWRMTITVPLSELFNAGPHEEATIERARRIADLEAGRARRGREARLRDGRRSALRQELQLLGEVHDVLTRIVRYQRILYEEGKAGFDALARTELQTLEAKMKIVRAESQLRELAGEETTAGSTSETPGE
jgi:hypothetical protein